VNYEDEDYVRLYTRETITWKSMGWEAQAVILFMMKGKFDRAGVFECSGVDPVEAVHLMTCLPVDVVRVGLPRVLESGVFEKHGTKIVWPNFIEAQTAIKSAKERQRASRERKRDLIRAGFDPRLRGAIIYFLQGERGGAVKIGRAKDLAKRIAGLETGRPDKLVLLGAFSGSRQDELDVHRLLSDYREKGEWFRDDPLVLAAAEFANENGRDVLDAIRNGAIQYTQNTSRNVTGSVSPEPNRVSPVTPNLTEPIRTELIRTEAEPPTPTPPPERDTTVPLNLIERCSEAGIQDQFARHYHRTTDEIDAEIREIIEYWFMGGGAGRRKRNWLQATRTRLHELGKAGKIGEAMVRERSQGKIDRLPSSRDVLAQARGES
jgi:hypothetical protein